MTTKEEQPLPTAAAAPPASTYCRKKKTDDNATFLKDVKDHFDEFVNASMEDHNNCFKNTMNKMFAMTKVAALRGSQSKEVDSSLPLQATVSTPSNTNVATESEQSLPTAVAPANSYCYKKKNESATFFKKLKDRTEEFLSASMEDHKNCYKNTINKMRGFTKGVASQDSQSHEVQISVPLQTTASE